MKETRKDSAKKHKLDHVVETEDSLSDSESSSDDEKEDIKPKKKKMKLHTLMEKADEINPDDYNLVISKNKFELMIELLK